MIELSTTPTTATVTVTGDLDLAERTQFPAVAARVAELRHQLLVADLCAMTFLDSTGAAFLISLADAARRRGGVMVLQGVSERDLFVLEVCGALESFRVDREHRCPGAEDAPSPWRRQRDPGAA